MVKKFKKSSDRYFLGVCGGIADWFGVPHWVVRTLWLVLSIVSIIIPGLIMYFLLSAIMAPADE